MVTSRRPRRCRTARATSSRLRPCTGTDVENACRALVQERENRGAHLPRGHEITAAKQARNVQRRPRRRLRDSTDESRNEVARCLPARGVAEDAADAYGHLEPARVRHRPRLGLQLRQSVQADRRQRRLFIDRAIARRIHVRGGRDEDPWPRRASAIVRTASSRWHCLRRSLSRRSADRRRRGRSGQGRQDGGWRRAVRLPHPVANAGAIPHVTLKGHPLDAGAGPAAASSEYAARACESYPAGSISRSHTRAGCPPVCRSSSSSMCSVWIPMKNPPMTDGFGLLETLGGCS